MTAPASSSQRQSAVERHPLLAAGPLYAFALPVPLLQHIQTLPSPLNEPLPSPRDTIANHQQQQQQQQQVASTSQHQASTSTSDQQPQTANASGPGAALSIRFPRARAEGGATQLHNPAQNAAQPDDNDSPSEDEAGDEVPSYASIGAGPNAPFIWLSSEDGTLQDQQFGVHRSLFTLPAVTTDHPSRASDFPASHVRGLQVMPIIRPRGISRAALAQNQYRGGVHALTNRALKAQGVQEAARRLGFRIIEGAAYVPGLGKIDSSLDEDEDSSDEHDVVLTDGTDEENLVPPRPAEEDGAEAEDDAGTTSAASTTTNASSAITPLQQSLLSSPPLKTWTILLLGGGHFAIAVIALNPLFEISPKLFPNGPPTPEQLLNIATTQPSTDRSILLLAHKTIHRYTTRRKQGGSQSVQDASGKFAKSAGAQLRRYGEQSLRDEIRATLSAPGWRTLIAQTERVWVRAGARAASGVLWNWPSGQSPLDAHRAQDTVVSIPVQTRKPTLGECVRVWAELTRIRVRSWSPDELAVLEQEVRAEREKGRAAAERRAKNTASIQSTEGAPKGTSSEAQRRKAAIAISERERSGRDRFLRMVDMIRKGKVDLLIDFLSKYEDELVKPGGGWGSSSDGPAVDPEQHKTRSIDTPLPLWWRAQEAGIPLTDLRESAMPSDGDDQQYEEIPTSVPSTLLQLAADAGAEDVVQYLLIERRADPTIPICPLHRLSTSTTTSSSDAVPHRTAYDLSHTRQVRDVFRRLMGEQPDWCDWANMGPGGARVPSALTEEMEERRDGKVKERRNLMRGKARAREAASAAKAPVEAQSAPITAPVPPPKASSNVANRLGGGVGGTNAPAGLRQAIDQQAGVTPEMRARIEREKRARAAEARFKAMQAKE